VTGHRLVTGRMRGWRYGALLLASCAAVVSANALEPTSDIDPAHQARIDQVLELYAFGKRYDWSMDQMPMRHDDESHGLSNEVMRAFRWERIERLLRPAIARGLTSEQVDEAIGYYATPDGGHYVDCAKDSKDVTELDACAMPGNEADFTLWEPLNRSKYTTDAFLYELMGRVDHRELGAVAVCDEFSRNPTLLARVIESCDGNNRCVRDGADKRLKEVLTPDGGDSVIDHAACIDFFKEIK
jgi:hypothetical protein